MTSQAQNTPDALWKNPFVHSDIRPFHESRYFLLIAVLVIRSIIMAGKKKHALVFGASGLIGWAIVDQLLCNYPCQGTFDTITALVNRPLAIQDSFWPLEVEGRPELQLSSGINLAQGTVESITELLKLKVQGIEDVTHVFYFGMRNAALMTSQEEKWRLKSIISVQI